MTKLAALAAGLMGVTAVAALSASGVTAPRLVGRAVLPADTFAPGPPSGALIPAANHRSPPFRSQPVQGISAVLPAGHGSFWAMEDNGYGTQANSVDFLLRMYRVTPHFETRAGGAGTVKVGRFIQLRDPNRKVRFPIINETGGRPLTGADFDIESVRRVKDGSLWFGDEFGPFLLHTDADGRVVHAPVALPGIESPENPMRGSKPANLGSSRGFEGMAIANGGKSLYPMLEGAVTGDAPSARRIYEFDIGSASYTGRRWMYRVDQPGDSIGDFTQVDEHRFLMIERDQNQGAAATLKRIYEVDLRHVGHGGYLTKRLVVDLLHIADPNLISLPARTGDVGLGNPFAMPFMTIESVLPLGADRLLVINDNNYPFGDGRNPHRPDDTEFVVISTGRLE